MKPPVAIVFLGIVACHIPGPPPFSTGPALPNCGDLVLDPGEMCDDGTRNNDEIGECTEQCAIPYCGDGLVHLPTEQCDLGSGNAEQSPCLPDCTLPATCGDGIVHPLEGCDLGTENNDVAYGSPGCSTLCHSIPYCGDGNLDGDYESCDDGNACEQNVCGDGFVYMDFESCDDANTSNNDACLNDCSLASCGDGFIESGVEECDGETDCGPDLLSRSLHFHHRRNIPWEFRGWHRRLGYRAGRLAVPNACRGREAPPRRHLLRLAQ